MRLRSIAPIVVTLSLGTLSLCASGCGGSGEVEEWRPEDHQAPSAEPDSAQQQRPQAPEPEPDAATIALAAAAIFQRSCARCHGADGHGGGPEIPEGATVADLSAPATQGRTDEELARIIREGQGEHMPEFGSLLNPRGVAIVVQHVRTLRQD